MKNKKRLRNQKLVNKLENRLENNVKLPTETPKTEEAASEKIFALDVGTRSVIGIVAELSASGEMKILATTRKEHQTRAMLDGQIHDVPEVAKIIGEVKEILEKKTGEIKSAAVAAAGRALYTMKAEGEIKVHGAITESDQQNLEFLGVQKAQEALANSKMIDNPAGYYCVGYSPIDYILDGIPLKSLVGQRGNWAKVSVIATFLPRQVIDSMQSALSDASLNMRALTLEPIAAINVLISPTMRHLNLALVDIGAGTSDVALTKNGSVFAYGMVPTAGDEITEAISQKFLLDFKVAEDIKRKATRGEGAQFEDILGTNYNLSAYEIIEPILPSVKKLAKSIAGEIVKLNGDAPQAVILVGGGALTPNLAEFVAECLSMPEDRVAVRRPEKVEGILELPTELQTSDSVTPLGILKVASSNMLHFLTVTVNGAEYSLFNFRELTVSDALLSAGVQLKKMVGHPGLALTVTVNGKSKFFPGTMGTMPTVKLNGEEAALETPLKNDCKIEVIRGKDGQMPQIFLKDVIKKSESKSVRLNGKDIETAVSYTVNGKTADFDMELKDGDIVEKLEENTVGDILKQENFSPEGKEISYTLNGNSAKFTLKAEITLNGKNAELTQNVESGDIVEYKVNDKPTLRDILDIDEHSTSIRITYNKQECYIPAQHIELTVNGKSANEKTVVADGAKIVYKELPKTATTVSDALLAVNFQPPAATSRMKFDILVNGKSAEFVDPVKNGDSLEVVLTKMGETSLVLGKVKSFDNEPNKDLNNDTNKDLAKILNQEPNKVLNKELNKEKTVETLEPLEKVKTVEKVEKVKENLDLSNQLNDISAYDLSSKVIMDYSAKRAPKKSAPKVYSTNALNIPGLSEAIAASKSQDSQKDG